MNLFDLPTFAWTLTLLLWAGALLPKIHRRREQKEQQEAWEPPAWAWQSRFYDHIIRNEQSFEKMSNYIIKNPKNRLLTGSTKRIKT